MYCLRRENTIPETDILQAMIFERKAGFKGTEVSEPEGLIVSEEVTEDDIISACSSSSLQVEQEIEEGYESCGETLVRVSQLDAEKALETLHKYFVMSNINKRDMFNQIYTIKKYLKVTNNLIQTDICNRFFNCNVRLPVCETG